MSFLRKIRELRTTALYRLSIPNSIPYKNYFSSPAYILLPDAGTDPVLSRLSKFNTNKKNDRVELRNIVKSLTEHFKYVTTKCTIKGWNLNVKSLLFVGT